MSETVLVKLMVSDHCKNGVVEMKYLDKKFEEYRRSHHGKAMPVWNNMQSIALMGK